MVDQSLSDIGSTGQGRRHRARYRGPQQGLNRRAGIVEHFPHGAGDRFDVTEDGLDPRPVGDGFVQVVGARHVRRGLGPSARRHEVVGRPPAPPRRVVVQRGADGDRGRRSVMTEPFERHRQQVGQASIGGIPLDPVGRGVASSSDLAGVELRPCHLAHDRRYVDPDAAEQLVESYRGVDGDGRGRIGEQVGQAAGDGSTLGLGERVAVVGDGGDPRVGQAVLVDDEGAVALQAIQGLRVHQTLEELELERPGDGQDVLHGQVLFGRWFHGGRRGSWTGLRCFLHPEQRTQAPRAAITGVTG